MRTRKSSPAWREEISRLATRARHQLRAGGLALVLRRTILKLGVYAGYQRQRLSGAKTFVVDGQRYRYFQHPYNATWRNERSVEIPLARAFVARQSGYGLEVGNVLSHYGPVTHTIIDRDEAAAGVRNIDVLDFAAPEGFNFILAISTLEHVGWDDNPRDENRAVQALDHLRGLLRPGGRLFVTCPIGHNPVLDKAILGNGHLLSERLLHRTRPGRKFTETDARSAPHVDIGRRGTELLWVGEFGPRLV